ncbi:MAG: hypothetical protein CVV28_02960 [Methanobacteriales archaeon HGW-Methanobacteriales-1]|jgi:hypothetical protein|nr:MAG: hypothetical protein CVV28_02960 [Methanobacteriales archaeon HGW-Methanobacteriales-1]
MKISKKDLREIWVIYLLLEQDNRLQQDIIVNLNLIAQYIIDTAIDIYEEELIEEYDPDRNLPDGFDDFDDFDREMYYETFLEDKNYSINFDDLEYTFAAGKEGDITEVDYRLDELEGLNPKELNQINLDDWPMEIVNLVELRNLYIMKSKKITDPMVSTTLRNLRLEGILETKPSPRVGRGPSPNINYLKKDLNVLLKILKKLLNPKLGIFSQDFSAHIMSSEYVKNLIDMGIVENLEKNLRMSFDTQEKKMILNIIKVSPSALLTVLEYIKRKFYFGINYSSLSRVIFTKEKTKFLIFELQLLLGDDLKRMPYIQSKLEYIITTDFKENPNRLDGTVLQKLSDSRLSSSLAPKSKKKVSYWRLYSDVNDSPL